MAFSLNSWLRNLDCRSTKRKQSCTNVLTSLNATSKWFIHFISSFLSYFFHPVADMQWGLFLLKNHTKTVLNPSLDLIVQGRFFSYIRGMENRLIYITDSYDNEAFAPQFFEEGVKPDVEELQPEPTWESRWGLHCSSNLGRDTERLGANIP